AKKWLCFCQSLKNTNHVKDSELASLFGKIIYEENLINSIYETKKSKSLVSATPLSIASISTSIVQDFQDSPDDEEDTRSSHEYLNNLEEEYQAKALLAKSKRFFKKGTQRFSSAKTTDQTECHKCGKKGHFARDRWSKVSVPSYQSPFQPKPLSPSQHKPELRPTKDFKAKYNKVKAKLALLSSSASTSKAATVKVLMALTEENDVISKEGARNYEWVKISMRKRILGVDQLTEDPSSSGQKNLVFVKSSADDTKVSIPGVERPWLSKAEGFILLNHDTGRILPAESQRNTTDPSVFVTDSSATDYDSVDESSVCSTLLTPLKKLDGVEPIFGQKTIKSILRSKSTFKAETLNGVIINKPSPAPAKGNKSSSTSKVNSAPAGKLKSVKIEVDHPLAGQRKPEGQWTRDERKSANLDQQLKSLIMSVLLDDQMNSVINCLTAKSTWDDLILYHEGPSDMKESRVMDLKLCYNTFKFKEGETLTQTFTRYKALMNELVNDGIKLSKLEINTGFINGLPKKWLSFCQSLRNTNHVKDSELASLFGKLKYEENLIDNIYETEKNKSLVSATPLSTAFISTSIVQDFQDSPDDEEDTRSSHEYLNDLEEEYQARALLAKSKRFFKKGTQRFSSAKATDQTECHKCGKKELRPTKDFEAKYNKFKAKPALLSLSTSASKAATVKNKGLIAKAYEWDEEEVSSDDNEIVEVRNGEWVKISMRKVHTLLEMEDNDDRKTYLDYLCIDLNYVEEQRNNLLSKHRDLVHELNACKEQLLVLKQAKLDFLTMQHVNTEILKENKNLRTELKELKIITETWLNSSNKVNQCISEQIPSQKKRIFGVDQLTKDPSSYRQKDLVFVKSSADDTKVSKPGVERPWLSEAKGFILLNHDTVCSTPLPLLKKLDDAEPISGPKTIKSILRSKSTFKVETLKGVIINEPSSALAKDNKSSSDSKVNSAPAGKLRVLCGSYNHDTNGHNKIISLEREINPRNPQHAFKRCEVCGSSTHTTTDQNDIEWFKRGEALQAKKAEALNQLELNHQMLIDLRLLLKDSRCSRYMTGVKSYLHKYVEQSGPKVVFGDDSTCTTEGYGSIKWYEHVAMNLVSQLESGFPAVVMNLSNTYVLDSSYSACSHYRNVSKQTARYE
ncbi:retrovirus-related pol polyprotein from transposon TNT 1-94, partial [Tanacetum coccineum]